MPSNHEHLKYFQDYIRQVNDLYQTGRATEHTYRGLLATLLEHVISINTTENKEIEYKVVNEPKRETYGATDYIITKNDIPVGYIEAKNINATDLKGVKKNGGNKEQFDRYKKALGNIAFTNYTHFVFYIGEKFIDEVTLAEQFFSQEIELNEGEIDKFIRLFNDFVFNDIPTIKSSKRLSNLMAKKAKLLANVIEDALNSDDESNENSKLHDLLNGFKGALIHDLSYRQFADVYAQTIAYGMFAAKVNNSEVDNFDRIIAAQSISTSNPFLSDLFENISGIKIDSRIKWVVDDLADLFRVTDMKAVLKKFGSLTKTQDPFINFYEDFLADYDSRLRKQRGVWYTPEPVIKFIVRAVDDILKTEFNLLDGIASDEKTTVNVELTGTTQRRGRNRGKAVFEDKIVPKVQILDPATGTGAFLNEVIRYIYANKFENDAGMWHGYVRDNLLPRLNGFELLMASYVIAHLKLEMLLKATGYTLQKEQRFNVYLTNSLEEYHVDTGNLFATFLSSEASEANYIKRDSPVMVVIGNPPYKGESANKGEWIMELMEDYKKEPNSNERLIEKNSKWINDDYVKFMRYGQHFVEKKGEGILAFINANGFLDNPTFRGVRWNLLNTYDKIYIIDLHGNSTKNEIAPDGSNDENVFDIKQGVSINLFVKTGRKKTGTLAEVYHYDIYGSRKDKYDFLENNSIESVPYTLLDIKAPDYFMVKKDFELDESIKEFEDGFDVNELFILSNSGIFTSRDSFVISDNKEVLKNKIQDFFKLEKIDIQKKYTLKEKASWKIDDIKNKSVEFNEKYIKPLKYRPFDDRFVYFNEFFIERTRKSIMHNFSSQNIALAIGRQGKAVGGNNDWDVISVTDKILDLNYYRRGGQVVFPLYIYAESSSNGELNLELMKEKRQLNLNTEITQKLAKALQLKLLPDHECKEVGSEGTFTPLDLIDYIYAVLHSPKYRNTYKVFLESNFPKIPYPTDKDTFFDLVELGAELRKTHLLENQLEITTNFPIEHDDIVVNEKSSKGVKFELHTSDSDIGRVWINDIQYFDNVSKIAWEFHIGGYQPAQKWLKDRNEVKLNYEDISHYKNIVAALVHTNSLMKKIDKVLILTK